MKRIIYTLSILLASQLTFAQQQPCGTDEVHAEMLKQNPALAQQKAQFNEAFKAYMKTVDLNQFKAQQGMGKALTPPKYIIPVVFHVMHNNNAYGEHYSDQDVINEIKNMNADYRASNPFRNRIRTVFKDVEGDAMIEFRLAKIDPQGNPTTGIEHIYVGPMVAKANDNQKYNSWDPQHYLNIWTVNSIRSSSSFAVGGYAYYPTSYPNAKYDGPIVSNRVGVLPQNAFTPFDLNTCAHEVGHYLGLAHPFEGSSRDSCVDGDYIFDTPPVYYIPTTDANANHNVCNDTNYNTCTTDNPDLPDQYENMMDYYGGSCASIMFTVQQVARMHFTLENYRRNLWQPENLVATGVNDTTFVPKTVPIPAFSIVGNQNLTDVRACTGTGITFKDNSYNGTVTAWEWNFGEGATPATFIGQNPGAVTYSTGGYKTVTLKVTGANGSATKTAENFIYIESSADARPAVAVHNIDISDIATSGWHEENEEPFVTGTKGQSWYRSTTAAYDGDASIVLPSNLTTAGFNYSLVSPNYNLTGASNPYFEFYYAFAANYASPPSGTPTQDALAVFVSTDCGKSWGAYKTKTGGVAYEVNNIPQTTPNPVTPNLLSTTPTNTPVMSSLNFIPAGPSQWKKMSISGSSIPAQANVKFKIQFSCGGGNNLYIDKVSVGFATSVNELSASDFKLSVRPNPFGSISTLSYNMPLKAKVDVRVYDIVGKEVGVVFNGTQESGSQELQIDRNKLNLNSGLYFVKMVIDGNKELTHKIVVN